MELQRKTSLPDAKTGNKLNKQREKEKVIDFFLTLPPKPMKKSVPFTVSPGLKKKLYLKTENKLFFEPKKWNFLQKC
jgi:hypothetical protein